MPSSSGSTNACEVREHGHAQTVPAARARKPQFGVRRPACLLSRRGRRTSGRRTTRCRTGRPRSGVGPWEGPWPTGEQYDAALLAEGDRRNVVDRYRYWTIEAIVADLDPRRHDFHVAIENWQHDFNIGTIVRTANAFLAARGAHRRQPALEPARRDGHRPLPARPAPRGRRRRSRRTCATQPGGPVALWGIDNLPGSLHLETTRCRAGSASCSARRARGCPTPAREACDATFSIAQFGSTRSINASAAAAIAMHAWVRAHADLSGDDAWRG